MRLYLYPRRSKSDRGKVVKRRTPRKSERKMSPSRRNVDPRRFELQVGAGHVFLSSSVAILCLRRPPLCSCASHQPSGLLVIVKRQCPGDVPSRVYTLPCRSSSYLPAQTACPRPRRPSAIFGAARRLPHACHASLPSPSFSSIYTRLLSIRFPPGFSRTFRSGPVHRDSIGLVTVVDPLLQKHLLEYTYTRACAKSSVPKHLFFFFRFPSSWLATPVTVVLASSAFGPPFPPREHHLALADRPIRTRFPAPPFPPAFRSTLHSPYSKASLLPRLPFRYRTAREACSESRKRSITFYARFAYHVLLARLFTYTRRSAPCSWSLILTARNWVA